VETAKIKDANVTNAKLASDCKRMIGEMVEIAGATLGGSDSRRAVIGGVVYESWVHFDGGAAVNGVTIPDTRDRVIGGASGTNAAGSSAGAVTVNLQHLHGDGTLAAAATSGANVIWKDNGGGPVIADGTHTHDVTGATGNALSAAQDIRQPTYYVYRFIYVG